MEKPQYFNCPPGTGCNPFPPGPGNPTPPQPAVDEWENIGRALAFHASLSPEHQAIVADWVERGTVKD